jgi:hypothetical protein
MTGRPAASACATSDRSDGDGSGRSCSSVMEAASDATRRVRACRVAAISAKECRAAASFESSAAMLAASVRRGQRDVGRDLRGQVRSLRGKEGCRVVPTRHGTAEQFGVLPDLGLDGPRRETASAALGDQPIALGLEPRRRSRSHGTVVPKPPERLRDHPRLPGSRRPPDQVHPWCAAGVPSGALFFVQLVQARRAPLESLVTGTALARPSANWLTRSNRLIEESPSRS